MTNRLRISPALLDGTLVAVLAATVRAVYLWQAARGPAFLEPLVDSQTYHDLAVGLATGGVYDQYILWQPAF